MPRLVSELQWSQLSERVAETMGLQFTRERRADLQRGLEAAARELRLEDLAACAELLLSAPITTMQLQVLASHLTVGETYFMRERKVFEVLGSRILPELVCSRRGREQRLRIWSAGCCTGEEPYSIAMLLHQVIPDLSEWHVTILATDINTRFLRTAATGSYGQWSFRDTPAWLQERYFRRTADGRHAILPEIRNLVTFEYRNLVEDAAPALSTGTDTMDVIFCRNLLMYFTAAQARKAIRNLHRALADGGWLAVSSSEASHALFPEFVAVHYPGLILYRKSDAEVRAGQASPAVSFDRTEGFPGPATEASSPSSLQAPAAAATESASPPPLNPPAGVDVPSAPLGVATALYGQGRYGEVVDTLLAATDRQPNEPRSFSLLARAFANQRRLADALSWCERWRAADKLSPAPHYLRAMILLEEGVVDEAQASLLRSLYLEPDLILAHFALGNIARGGGRTEESRRHFTNALRLLRRCQPHETVPEGEGLTAGRLIETITSVTETETAP